MNVDLHCHSTMSDGVLEPAVVAARAQANGVDLWALTDHDELAGLAEARQTAESLGMRFVTGVEISVTWAGHTVHIVGLNVDEHNKALNEGLAGIRNGRAIRAHEMADKLESLGIPNSYEGALPYAANPDLISRTHFARFLVQEGYCSKLQEAFDKYLKDGGPAYVPMHWSTLDDAVGWITGAGGRAVIAHPGRYNYTPMQFDALYDHFLNVGGVAIEVMTGSHTPDQYAQYATVARQYGFMASSGSDFHSPREGKLDLGEVPPLPADLKPVWHDWI
ncbi:3',5'-nucleoside bisphosphate phosphatase [Pusillimonas sp. ANT_WB101]|uniref:3',5'-nucleoside bisphosphate phosphatase n=1 Tax=Pusillimonas sp. ANT_WB101 TaxID=2597356 RepID=UPI00351A5DBF